MTIEQRHCVPCEGGVPALSDAELRDGMAKLPAWCVTDEGRLSRSVECNDFGEAMAKLNEIAEIAEREQHHPDLFLTDYRRLRVDVWTHAIQGLSLNDLILAGLIDSALGRTK